MKNPISVGNENIPLVTHYEEDREGDHYNNYDDYNT